MSPRRGEGEGTGWEGLEGLDRLLEHRTRLSICVLLSRHEVLTFSRFKSLLRETDGALGAHLRRLEERGYILARKEFRRRLPVTWYSLSRQGKAALEGHLEALARLIASSPAGAAGGGG